MRDQTPNTRPDANHRRPVTQHPRSRRIVRLPEVTEITGLSRTTIWRRQRDGSFPQPIRLGGEHTRAVGWWDHTIYDWIDERPPTAPPTQQRSRMSRVA